MLMKSVTFWLNSNERYLGVSPIKQSINLSNKFWQYLNHFVLTNPSKIINFGTSRNSFGSPSEISPMLQCAVSSPQGAVSEVVHRIKSCKRGVFYG